MKQREIEPTFKIVNIPNKTVETEFTEQLYNRNAFLPEGSLNFIREYSGNGKVKNFLYKCTNNLLSIIQKKRVEHVDFVEYSCYEDFSILQCFKCLAYGHSAKNFALSQACKNGNQHYREWDSISA